MVDAAMTTDISSLRTSQDATLTPFKLSRPKQIQTKFDDV
jgi:hypothetical protein